jgi:hypothetical protein
MGNPFLAEPVLDRTVEEAEEKGEEGEEEEVGEEGEGDKGDEGDEEMECAGPRASAPPTLADVFSLEVLVHSGPGVIRYTNTKAVVLHNKGGGRGYFLVPCSCDGYLQLTPVNVSAVDFTKPAWATNPTELSVCGVMSPTGYDTDTRLVIAANSLDIILAGTYDDDEHWVRKTIPSFRSLCVFCLVFALHLTPLSTNIVHRCMSLSPATRNSPWVPSLHTSVSH